MPFRLRGFWTILTLSVLVSCATPPTPPPPKTAALVSSDATFPTPPALQPQVAFWRNVYAVWGRHQVALHDNRHMSLIYEVVTLPGEVGEGYTAEQQALVKGRYENLKAGLRQLEFKMAANAPLTPEEQALATRLRPLSSPWPSIPKNLRHAGGRGCWLATCWPRSVSSCFFSESLRDCAWPPSMACFRCRCACCWLRSPVWRCCSSAGRAHSGPRGWESGGRCSGRSWIRSGCSGWRCRVAVWRSII